MNESGALASEPALTSDKYSSFKSLQIKRDREEERERECVCVCVREREREREKERERERERESVTVSYRSLRVWRARQTQPHIFPGDNMIEEAWNYVGKLSASNPDESEVSLISTFVSQV